MIVIAVLGGIGVAAGTFKLFFDDLEELFECFMYALKPNILSLFDGDYMEDQWKTMKLIVWLALSIGSGVLAFISLDRVFG